MPEIPISIPPFPAQGLFFTAAGYLKPAVLSQCAGLMVF
jgi:hypothetical protein